MSCTSCGHENRTHARFCEHCGEPLARGCPSCGTELRSGARFCDACGTPVGAASSDRAAPAPREAERDPRSYTPAHLAQKILRSKSALEGERKQVTVLFADVKGSMDLAERVDPERWHEILDRFFQILADGVHRFEGTVNQYTGDGIMALFGAPLAHEDHAQRACYAALHLRNAVRSYADELRLSESLDFAARIGINSGEVVVGKIGDDLRMDYTAQGHTVGLAQRMESIAAAGSICVSEVTAERVKAYVALRDLGEARVKGTSAPVKVFELTGMGAAQTRFDVSRSRGLTRFVGRDDDMKTLEQALEQARSGSGQVVGVVADAGTGKSRLCFEFVERVRAQGLPVNQGSGVAHGKNIPFLPILQIFRSYFGISERDADRAAREKIAGRLLLIDPAFAEELPLVFDFMGVPDPDRPAPGMDPDARQRRLYGVMRRLTESGDSAEVGVTLMEDLHWIDAGSEAWLEQMVDAAAGTQSLLVVNFRPEYRADWMQKSWYRQLPLLPLGSEAIRELLDDLLGSDSSLEGLAEAIHERTAGNPFFTEEVVQTLCEAGNLEGERGAYKLVTPVAQLEVPANVQAVLAARIDRLADREKQVLQTASVIGKEFAEPILARVVSDTGAASEGELLDVLRELKNGEFVHEASLYPVTEYAFKHPLTQEVALGSQLRDRRQKSHAAVARAIEAAYADKLDENAALLAHHQEEAGEPLIAAHWHRRAAEWLIHGDASASYAHWRRVRTLAREAAGQEGAADLATAACDMLLSNGWRMGTPIAEVEELAREGKVLAERGGDASARIQMDVGLALCHYLNGRLRDAFEPAERAMALAAELGELGPQIEAANVRLDIDWNGGRLREVLAACERHEPVFERDPDYGMDRYHVGLLNWLRARKAMTLWWVGRADEAIPLVERCLRVASERGELETMVWIGGFYAYARDFSGIDYGSLQRGQQAVELAERAGSPITQVMAQYLLGFGLFIEEQPEAASEVFERAVERSDAGNLGRHYTSQILGKLAEARLALGDLAGARAAAERGVAHGRDIDSWIYGLTAQRALVRVRIAEGAEAAEVDRELAAAEALVDRTGARACAPLVTELRARAKGDDPELLRAALAEFESLGATGHVDRLSAELEGG